MLIIEVYFRVGAKNHGVVNILLFSLEIIEMELTLDAIYSGLKNVRKEHLVL